MPGFFNVLKGEMSIVGPRPHLARDLRIYFREQSRRHEVKPGITGWAQVNGRNAINMEKKFRMDVWYVDNRSFVLDLKVVFLTTVKIFKREDIYPPR
jgi:sugar transferase EpsL